MDKKTISGFSKLSKRGKLKWIVENFFKDPEAVARELVGFWHGNDDQQKILDGFSENTISNFPMPFGVAPNFLINGKTYCVPMVIEESSVVAAASAAAKFWQKRGGFTAEILGTTKVGQVHFLWDGDAQKLKDHFDSIKEILIDGTSDLTNSMHKRGGGILSIELLDYRNKKDNYFQIKATFETCDSMGANFINSILERFGTLLQDYLEASADFNTDEKEIDVIMAILSNYTPNNIVKVSVSCPVQELGSFVNGMGATTFAKKFENAVSIAKIDSERATTHNKGIYNGIDAVTIATGNDFRAVEACGHTFASRDGYYSSLSDCKVENDIFTFWLEIPFAVGTVGGLTKLHPLAKRSLEMLGNPTAKELMTIIAATGLAQNFAALRSLITTGIQSGHMKMHLHNILNHLQASDFEIEKSTVYFETNPVSFTAVRAFLKELRKAPVIS